MSFLVIGNELDALYLGKYLKEHGWPTMLMSKGRFDYRSDCELVNPEEFKKAGFDYKKGLLTNITIMEIIDLAGNKRECPTDTVLVNLATYKNEIFKSLGKSCKIYENSTFIDKNNENIFIQHGEHGTLIKSKHVFSINDLNLAKTIGEIKTKKSIRATLERNAEKGKLTLKFLPTGYLWVVNYSDRVAELCVVADNPDQELADFMLEDDFSIIYKRNVVLPYFKKERLLNNNGVYLGGASALINNNLTFYNLIAKLKFIQYTSVFAHELMTKRNISYVYLTKDYDNDLAKCAKKGLLFWSLPLHKRNDLIKKMNFSKFALDFNSAFDNISLLSSTKLKLIFG